MELILLVITLGILGGIIYQDFSRREVSVSLLAILFVCLIIQACIQERVIPIFYYFLFNFLVVLLLILSTKLYFLVRKGKGSQFLDRYIGKGDLIIIIIFCVGLSNLNFIVFLLISFTCALILSLLLHVLNIIENHTIPLAGYLAAVYCILMLSSKLYKVITFYNDDLLLSLFSRI